VAEIGGLTDAEKLNVAVLRLNGDAAEFFQSKQECREAATFADLKTELLLRYRTKKSARFFRELLTNMKRGAQEDIEAFADRVRRTNANTYDAGGSVEYAAAIRFEADQRALDAFLNGLSGELGRQCRLTSPKTFDEAVEAAIRIHEVDRHPAMEELPSRRVFRVPGERCCFSCGDTGHLARQCRRGRRCFICGAEGHVARECRSRYGVRRGQGLNDTGVGEATKSDPL
jgi:hypothetical protein